MKKTVSIILALLLVASVFSACSSPKMKMSEQHQKYGLEALKIADAYLDLEISLDDAYQRIGSLSDSVDALPEEEGTENETGNLVLSSEVSLLESAFWSASVKSTGISVSTSSDILARRNSLAELLGKSKR